MDILQALHRPSTFYPSHGHFRVNRIVSPLSSAIHLVVVSAYCHLVAILVVTIPFIRRDDKTHPVAIVAPPTGANFV
jgi:hypothetical protein